jgi:hypothetical protein
MRAIKSLDDVQIVLRELLDWKSLKTTKDWDFRGLRITNASPARDPNDYVILSQLKNPASPGISSNESYTQVWESPGQVTTGDLINAFVVGLGREGTPNQVWVTARVAPVSSDFSINISVDGNNLLQTPLILPISQTLPVFSSNFVSPTPQIGLGATIFPVIINGDGAVSLVSMGLVVKR